MTRLLFRQMKEPGDEQIDRFVLDLARRLHNGAVLPGLALALFGGIWALVSYRPEYLHQGWFHAKLFIALIFIVMQAYSIRKTYELLRSPSRRSRVVFAVMHFSAGLFLFLALLLIRFKPF